MIYTHIYTYVRTYIRTKERSGNEDMSNEDAGSSQVSKEVKCGVCKPCMNPHWHKRCLALPPTNNVRKSSKSLDKKEKEGKKEDSFVDKLRDIIAADGSMKDSQHVPEFLDICDIATDWSHKKALLKVLQASPDDSLEAFVSQGGLIKMEVWLADALPDSRQRFIALMLTTLSNLPVTLASLRKPCELGKAVGKLRKMPELDESIRSQARILVMKWKSLIETKAEKTPKLAPTKTEPSSPKGTGAQAGLGDVDIFNVKPQKKQVATVPAQKVRVVASNAAKSQISDVKKNTSVARVSASPLDSLSGPDVSQQSRPQQSSRPRTVLTPATNGIPLMTGHITAAQRAKLAADSIPDEPPREKKKQTTRKICWAAEANLVSVRLFLKDQPPCKAKHDATLDDITKEEAENPETHENFEQAAKQQHHSEAQALKDFKAQEDEERKGIEQRLRAMRPAIPWRDPPMIPQNIFDEYGVAGRGEKSTEKIERKQQTTKVAAKVYTKENAPPFPEEAPVGASMPMQPMHLIPKIPLSIEEARKMTEKRATIPMNTIGSTKPRPPQLQQRPVSVRPPPVKQPPAMTVNNVSQHRPMASQKFRAPMLGLHGANKAQQPKKMTAQVPTVQQPVAIQHAPRPMLVNDSRPLCAFFNRPKGCIHGDKCKFAHVHGVSGQQPPAQPTKRPPTSDGGAPRKMVKHV